MSRIEEQCCEAGGSGIIVISNFTSRSKCQVTYKAKSDQETWNTLIPPISERGWERSNYTKYLQRAVVTRSIEITITIFIQ